MVVESVVTPSYVVMLFLALGFLFIFLGQRAVSERERRLWCIKEALGLGLTLARSI
jgi:hypothetical protein